MGQYAYALRRHFPYVLLTFLVTIGITWVVSSRLPTIYTTSSLLRITPFGISRPDYGTFLYFEQLAVTFSTILKRAEVGDEALRQLQVETLPQFSVDVVSNSDLLQISVSDSDPELAQRAANVLTQVLVQATRDTYGNSIGGIQEILNERLGELESEIAQLAAERSQLLDIIPRDTTRINEIDGLLSSRQTAYAQLNDSYNQALVASATQLNLISVVEDASLPTVPSSPNLPLLLVGAAVAGLIAGLGLALISELVNPKFYGTAALHRVIGAPVVGEMPATFRSSDRNVFSTPGPLSDAVRHVRTYVHAFVHSQNTNLVQVDEPPARKARSSTKTAVAEVPAQSKSPGKAVLVAGVEPKDAGSKMSLNLAIAFANTGMSVILVDANLRGSTLNKSLGVTAEAGLVQTLTRESELEPVIQFTAHQNLSFLPAGTAGWNGVDLLISPAMGDLLLELRRCYDIVVLDAPPIAVATDAIGLALEVDGVLLVLRRTPSVAKVTQLMNDLTNVTSKLIGSVTT